MNLKSEANQSSWQVIEDLTRQIVAPRIAFWNIESLEGDWTRSGGAVRRFDAEEEEQTA